MRRSGRHDLREVCNALRWVVRTGAQWDSLPHAFPAWPVVYQQARRWIAAGVFAAMAHDRRALLRVAAGREPERRRSSSTAARCNRRRARRPGGR
jgi:transposase